MSLDLTPKQYLEMGLKDVCQGLANAGCPSLAVGLLPNQQIIHIQSNYQAGTKEYADEVEFLARRLMDHAKSSVPLLKSTLILPQ